MEELERLQKIVVMEKITAKEAMKELTMVLMYLSRFENDSAFNQDKDYYAWRGYDFDVINKLWDKAYILPKMLNSAVLFVNKCNY